MQYCTMEVYSHFVKVTDVTEPAKAALRRVCERLVQYKWESVGGSFVKTRGKYFWAMDDEKREFRFNINMLPEILEIFGRHGIRESAVRIIRHDLFEPAQATFKMPETWTARPEQVPLIDYLASPGPLKTVALRTGGGKTSCSLKAAENIGERLMIVVLGRYVEKWVGDVTNNYGTDNGGLLLIRGCNQLMQALAIAEHQDINADVVIVSHRSIQDYITKYEQTRFAELPSFMVPPEDIYRVFKIGVRIVDEVHQHFHLNFMIDCYTHVPKTIALSATLEPDDKFLNSMYELAFPRNTRMGGGVDKKYVKCTSLRYGLKDYRKVRCARKGQYSHDVYERWLMKHKDSLNRYLALIYTVVVREYLKIRKPGHKLLIFATGVEMCGIIRDYIKHRNPELTVCKYNSEDDYDSLLNSDVSVSTLGSAGTAVDISGLITVLMTTALSSKQGNEQAIGRLREIHDGSGIVPHFVFLTCRDIPKHLTYEKKKFEALRSRIIAEKIIDYDGIV